MKEGEHYIVRKDITLKECVIRCDTSSDMPNPNKKLCQGFDFVKNTKDSTKGTCTMYTDVTGTVSSSPNRLYRAGQCNSSKYQDYPDFF